VEWEEPGERVHRAVNVGRQPFEQITVFLLDVPTPWRNRNSNSFQQPRNSDHGDSDD
jgi:hypothetical protein